MLTLFSGPAALIPFMVCVAALLAILMKRGLRDPPAGQDPKQAGAASASQQPEPRLSEAAAQGLQSALPAWSRRARTYLVAQGVTCWLIAALWLTYGRTPRSFWFVAGVLAAGSSLQHLILAQVTWSSLHGEEATAAKALQRVVAHPLAYAVHVVAQGLPILAPVGFFYLQLFYKRQGLLALWMLLLFNHRFLPSYLDYFLVSRRYALVQAWRAGRQLSSRRAWFMARFVGAPLNTLVTLFLIPSIVSILLALTHVVRDTLPEAPYDAFILAGLLLLFGINAPTSVPALHFYEDSLPEDGETGR